MINRIWFPLFLFLAFLLLLIDGSRYLPFRGLAFPLVIGGMGIVLSGVEVIRGTLKKKDEETEAGGKKLKYLKSHILTLIIMLAIVPMVWLLGFMVAIPLHVFIFLRYLGQRWRKSFAIAASMAIIFYFGLYLGMRIPFNMGLLFGD
jgi:hypothetical protein